MKPRRRKGATLGLVAVSLLVIIVIGVGCYFLIKLCGGGREVGNSTDAGTLNVAKVALRSSLVAAPVPNSGSGQYPDFLACADPQHGNQITLFTYNRCVAMALLAAINAAQPDAGSNSVANAQSMLAELQTVGQTLSSQMQAQNTLADPSNNNDAFSSVASNNSLKMFGNNAIKESGYKVAYMKPGGSTNVWFSNYTLQSAPMQLPSGVPAYNLLTAVPGLANTLVNQSANINFTPNPAIATAYSDLGGSGNAGNMAYQNAGGQGCYMQGYVPMSVAGISTPIVGVPVFPQQRPHLVSLADFNSTDPTKTYTDTTGFTPPNSFMVHTASQDAKSGNFGGAVACAIVGAVQQNIPLSGPAYGAASSNCDFVAEFPSGYIAITNDPTAGGPVPASYTGPPDGTNNIFNWELNPLGNGVGINLTSSQVTTGGGTAGLGTGTGTTTTESIFYQNTGSAATAIADWMAYNAAGDPVSPTTWTDSQGNTQTGPPQDSLAGIFVAINGGTSSRPATAADMYGLTSTGMNCLTDLINNNMGFPNNPDSCYTNLAAFSNAYGRTDPNGAGGGSTNSTVVYWSNVDEIKAEICKAFNTPYVYVAAPGVKSGLGAYKVAKSGSTAPYMPWYGPDSMASAGDPTNTYQPGLPPLEKVSSVMDLINQVGSTCATNQVMSQLLQRANEICPGTSYNDLSSLLTSSTIGMGQTLYLQRANYLDPTSPLVLKPSVANDPNNVAASVQPDGSTTSATATCDSGSYNLYNGGHGLIDSQSQNQSAGADNNLHDQPYTVAESTFGSGQPTTLAADDHASFVTSSGYQGMLGKLEFYQTTSGTGAFSRPN